MAFFTTLMVAGKGSGSGTKKRIVASCHSDNLAGHFWRDKTREKISSSYYLWLHSVESLMHNHAGTTGMESSMTLTTMSRLVIAANEPVWYWFDRPTKRDTPYIITCTDYHSKWAEAQALPLKIKEAGNVADFLYDLVITHSCRPSIIMSEESLSTRLYWTCARSLILISEYLLLTTLKRMA